MTASFRIERIVKARSSELLDAARAILPITVRVQYRRRIIYRMGKPDCHCKRVLQVYENDARQVEGMLNHPLRGRFLCECWGTIVKEWK